MSPLGTDARLRRLLAAVPWIASQDGPTVEDVCARFDYTEEELAEDLNLLFVCGVYPFTADTLIEADIDDGRVWIHYADYFARPLRLAPPEALALVAAGSALLAVPGSDPGGPLARGLAKLAAVLGVDPDEAIDVELGVASGDVLATLQDAATTHRQVDLDYYSFGRDAWSRRTINPNRVFSSAGSWYVWGWCHRVQDDRLFRVDRVRDPVVLDAIFAPRAEGPPAVYAARADDPVYVLEVGADDAWVAREFPNEGVTTRRGGRLRITLRVSERPRLERLLLQLGPSAKVLEGDPTVGPEAARRVLARYAG